MDVRFAFTAQFWGEHSAVVCRAVEDRPGPVVEQQFGEFKTWTQAHAFSTKLNEGLYLDPLEVRQIVTSSLLATARVVQEALNSTRSQRRSAIELAREGQFRFVLAQLALALTSCLSAPLLSGAPMRRMLLHAREVLYHSTSFLELFEGDDREQLTISSRIQALDAALQEFSFLDSAA